MQFVDRDPQRDVPNYVFRPERSKYSEKPEVCVRTALTRCRPLLNVVERQKEFRDSGVHALIAGAGMGPGSSFVPQLFAAQCDRLGIDYNLRVVDISRTVVKHLQHDKYVVTFPPEHFFGEDNIWRRYLEATSQESIQYGQRPSEDVSRQMWNASRMRTGGSHRTPIYSEPDGRVEYARIPDSFTHKRATGEVQITQDDIATAFLPIRAFDVVDLQFVLYQLNNEGKRRALRNVASSLREDGVLIVSWYDGISNMEAFIRAGLRPAPMKGGGLNYFTLRKNWSH